PARTGRWWTAAKRKTTDPAAKRKDKPIATGLAAASTPSCRNGFLARRRTATHRVRTPSHRLRESSDAREARSPRERPRPGPRPRAATETVPMGRQASLLVLDRVDWQRSVFGHFDGASKGSYPCAFSLNVNGRWTHRERCGSAPDGCHPAARRP